MKLSEYVMEHTVRGACRCGKCIDAPPNPDELQPDTGHTADLIFFKVAKKGDPKKEEFEKLVKSEFPHWLDGKEHSYLETGADIGDQGLALMAMGLGSILGVWELLTPETLMPFLDDGMKKQMAGAGYITIKSGRPLLPTYVISKDGKSIKCLKCGKTSYNPADVRERYCGNCYVFHDREEVKP